MKEVSCGCGGATVGLGDQFPTDVGQQKEIGQEAVELLGASEIEGALAFFLLGASGRVPTVKELYGSDLASFEQGYILCIFDGRAPVVELQQEFSIKAFLEVKLSDVVYVDGIKDGLYAGLC